MSVDHRRQQGAVAHGVTASSSSLHKQRALGAVGQLHRAGLLRDHLPGAAVLHADDQPEVSAEISAQKGSPWLVHHPTLENFWYLITYPNFQTYYLNSVHGHGRRGGRSA